MFRVEQKLQTKLKFSAIMNTNLKIIEQGAVESQINYIFD